MRAVKQPLGERLGRNHLSASRDDQPLELTEQAARVAVGGDEHTFRFERVDRIDASVLADLHAGLARARREAAYQARRVDGRIVRMEDRCGESRHDVAPFCGEAVLEQRFVFGADLVPLFVVGSDAQASGAA